MANSIFSFQAMKASNWRAILDIIGFGFTYIVFFTQPLRPSAEACCWVNFLKKTPCTRPNTWRTRRWKLTILFLPPQSQVQGGSWWTPWQVGGRRPRPRGGGRPRRRLLREQTRGSDAGSFTLSNQVEKLNAIRVKWQTLKRLRYWLKCMVILESQSLLVFPSFALRLVLRWTGFDEFLIKTCFKEFHVNCFVCWTGLAWSICARPHSEFFTATTILYDF